MPAVKRFFVDTNVLLYSLDPAEEVKRGMAQSWVDALWKNGAGQTSWQVLNEFYSNAVRKLRLPVPSARHELKAISQWQPVGFGLGIVERAWHWMDTAGLPYWDALIVASAEATGCTHLLSEDFQAGQRFGALTVVNPFRTRPDAFDLSTGR
jgi:predicted nucleic acid-binding protein